MAVVRPDLTIDVTVGAECSNFEVADVTGAYDVSTNPEGYGLPDGPTVNNVTSLIVVVTNESEGWYLTYTFTISSGTITACTLSVSGATATNILAELSSTVWPFADGVNEFDATADYGVTIPELTDGIYTISYTIGGTAIGGDGQPTVFSFTTSEQPTLSCDLCSCIEDMFLDASGCGCDDKMCNAMKARGYFLASKFANERGDTEIAIANFEKSQSLCEGNCKDC